MTANIFFLSMIILLVAAFAPAVFMSESPPEQLNQRRAVAFVTAAVLIPPAALLTLYSAYAIVIVMPLFGFCLSAVVAGIAGHQPGRNGLAATSAYTAIVMAIIVSHSYGPSAEAIAVGSLIVLLCGAAGRLLVSTIWFLRGRSRS